MRRLLYAAVVVTLAACAPSAVATPGSPSDPSAAATAVATPPATPDAQPTSTSVAIATEEPEPSTVATLSPAEQDLLTELRTDAAVNCTPRRTDLPPRAIAGV